MDLEDLVNGRDFIHTYDLYTTQIRKGHSMTWFKNALVPQIKSAVNKDRALKEKLRNALKALELRPDKNETAIQTIRQIVD